MKRLFKSGQILFGHFEVVSSRVRMQRPEVCCCPQVTFLLLLQLANTPLNLLYFMQHLHLKGKLSLLQKLKPQLVGRMRCWLWSKRGLLVLRVYHYWVWQCIEVNFLCWILVALDSFYCILRRKSDFCRVGRLKISLVFAHLLYNNHRVALVWKVL